MATRPKSPRRIRALLCAGAAGAVLIGGGSSYALWSQEGLLEDVESVNTATGEWEWTASFTDVEWWDTSDGLDGSEYVDGQFADGWTPPEGVTWTNAWAGDWDDAMGGYPIDLEAFHMVPGDTVTGKFTIDADLTGLDGQNLRAEVTSTSYVPDTAGVGDADLPLVVGVTTAGSEVTITVAFPDAENDYVGESAKPVTVALGTFDVTLTQVRPAAATS